MYFNTQSPHNVAEIISNPEKYILSNIVTNNTAEIIAIIRALEIAYQLKLDNIEIRTDSEWIVKYFKEFCKNTVYRIFTEKDHNFKIDLKALLKLEEAAARVRNVEFSYVNGHNVDIGNLWADAGAKMVLNEFLDRAKLAFLCADQGMKEELMRTSKSRGPRLRLGMIGNFLSSLTDKEFDKLRELLMSLPSRLAASLVFPDLLESEEDKSSVLACTILDYLNPVISQK